MTIMMKDLESNSSSEEPLLMDGRQQRKEGSGGSSVAVRVCERWMVLLCASCLFFIGSYLLSATSSPSAASVALVSGGGSSGSEQQQDHSLSWHIKPIKPHHHGHYMYLTEQTEQGVVYKRIFTAPCGDGMLVFNIGPAASYEPYAYDIYEDAYAYSNNNGLCVLYPSYKGTQTSDIPLWMPTDPTEAQVDLGDLPNKISTRVVVKKDTKTENKKRGGDFLIIRSGNFYNPAYYKHLKDGVNSFQPDEDIETALMDLVAEIDDKMMKLTTMTQQKE